MDQRWNDYLFEAHSPETLRDWAQRLRLFRFVRAYGGHANDGDSLVVVYGYSRRDELERFFAQLGIRMRERDEPPGWCKIAGQDAFVWCTTDQIKISMASGYAVTAADVERAALVEQALAGAALQRIDPPVTSRHCICPAFYPELFE